MIRSTLSLAPGLSRVSQPQRGQNRFNGFGPDGREAVETAFAPHRLYTGLKPGANEKGFSVVRGAFGHRQIFGGYRPSESVETTMTIRRQDVADKLADYLHHQLSLAELVDWAEAVMMDGDLDERDLPVLRQVVARIGLADVRAFGLAWEDCEELLHQLGYAARVEVVTA